MRPGSSSAHTCLRRCASARAEGDACTRALSTGDLSFSEFEVAADKLGITVGRADDMLLREHDSIEALFNDLDADSDGALTQHELAEAVHRFPDYQGPLISSFTNGAGADPPSGVEDVLPDRADAPFLQSPVVLEAQMQVAGPPSAIYPGQRRQIKQFFADRCGVELSAVTITFLEADDHDHDHDHDHERRSLQGHGAVALRQRHARRARALQATSTTIEAKIFMADRESAEAAEEMLPQSAADVPDIPAFAGLDIESIEPARTERFAPRLPAGEVVLGALIFLCVLPMCLCCVASSWAKRNTANLPADTEPGCCSTGCCSFNAVGPWACGEFVAAVMLLVFMGWLYGAMDDVVNGEVMPVIDAFNGFFDPTLMMERSAMVNDLYDNIRGDATEFLREHAELLRGFPAATIVPGLLAGIFLLLGALCPLAPVHKGSYCVTKLFIVLAKLTLIVACVFYVAFAAIAALISYPPPQLEHELNFARGACIMVPAMANQLITDNRAALATLQSAGQDTSEYDALIIDIDQIISHLDEACGHFEGFITESFDCYLPCMLAVFVIFYALMVNQTLCCAAGCCKGPPVEAPKGKAPPPTMSGVTAGGEAEMGQVQVTIKGDETIRP